MTQNELAALSEAATQGPWLRIDGPEYGRVVSAFLTSSPDVAMVAKVSDIDLIITLVNAYRTGKLVLIGDDAVEQMATAMRNVPSWDGSLIVSDAALTDNELRDLATAVLSALTGETP